MKNKINAKIVLSFIAIFTFVLMASSEHPRCQDSCTPDPEYVCSVGTGDPDNPTAFCNGMKNMTTIPTLPIGELEP
jgi:hypothetical protein